jgi:hypothetical protein
MATAKTESNEKFENQDFDLFAALGAVDAKQYGWYDGLNTDQRKKFSPYMMLQWTPTVVPRNPAIAAYYIISVNEHANQHYFDSTIQRHPELQWMMLCAASPGTGKQQRKWVPKLSEKISKYVVPAKVKDYTDFYSKIYPNAATADLKEVAASTTEIQHKRVKIAKLYPSMKLADIETLSQVMSDEELDDVLNQYGM